MKGIVFKNVLLFHYFVFASSFQTDGSILLVVEKWLPISPFLYIGHSSLFYIEIAKLSKSRAKLDNVGNISSDI